MEYAYSILMGIFGTLILLYGLIVFLSGDIEPVPKKWSSKISDKKLYARQFGKVIMLVATAPILSALVALFGSFMMISAIIVLVGGIAIGVKIMPKDE